MSLTTQIFVTAYSIVVNSLAADVAIRTRYTVIDI